MLGRSEVDKPVKACAQRGFGCEVVVRLWWRWGGDDDTRRSMERGGAVEDEALMPMVVVVGVCCVVIQKAGQDSQGKARLTCLGIWK